VDKGQLSLVRDPFNALFQLGRLGDLSDGQLLARALAAKADPSAAEMAFTALVERHGPMVLRVCRSIVRDSHDAEDAFQATFLVLVRKASRLKIRDTLGPWLHDVALKVSLCARTAKVHRRAHLRIVAEQATPKRALVTGSDDDIETNEISGVVQEEIGRLPERFRTGLVLCDLQGLTYTQAAHALNLPMGTVQSRLSRARERLRERLIRRGLGPSETSERGAIGTVGFLTPWSGLPHHLVVGTPRACLDDPINSWVHRGVVSRSVLSLVEGGSRMMFLSQAARVSMACSAALALTLSCLAVYSQVLTQTQSDPKSSPVTPSPQALPSPSFGGLPAIPPPRELIAASGQGKFLVYAVDTNGERVGVKQRDRRSPEGEVVVHKEVDRQASWVVVTGIVDHKSIRENLVRVWPTAKPDAGLFYRRVDLERQVRSPDGTWSK
jgi:RNA polymerase sigma factor (sigma-70 family)